MAIIAFASLVASVLVGIGLLSMGWSPKTAIPSALGLFLVLVVGSYLFLIAGLHYYILRLFA